MPQIVDQYSAKCPIYTTLGRLPARFCQILLARLSDHFAVHLTVAQDIADRFEGQHVLVVSHGEVRPPHTGAQRSRARGSNDLGPKASSPTPRSPPAAGLICYMLSKARFRALG